MTDEQRRPDEAAPDDSPWWARSPQDAWADAAASSPRRRSRPARRAARPRPGRAARPGRRPRAATCVRPPTGEPAAQPGPASYDPWSPTPR